MPRRRTVLAGLAGMALAGCTEGQSPTGTRTTSPSPTASPEPPTRVESDWPTPGYGAGASRYAPTADGPVDQVGELWRVPVDATPSPPVVADGTVYVGADDGAVRALDAATGSEQWRATAGSSAGAPRVVGDRCYVPVPDAVVALERDGTTAWTADAPDRTSLLATDSGLYYVAAGDEPALVALDREAGERWRAGMADPWRPRLFAGGGYVFVGTGLHHSEPWIFAAADGTYRGEHRPQRGADETAERCYLDGLVLSADGFFGDVEANAVGDGSYDRAWKTAVDAYNHLRLAGGAARCFLAVDAGDEPGLYAVALDDGDVAWHTDAVTTLSTRPAVTSEVVVVATPDDLRGIAPGDGSELWRHPLAGVRGLAVADDLVYASTADAVVALRAG